MKKAGILLAILLITAGLRLVNLKADPPLIVPRLSGSSSLYCDDGIYAHNARNKILFDRWVLDDWNPFLYNPLLTGIYYVSFLLMGVKITVVKLVNILLGCLVVGVFYRIALRFLDPWPAGLITLMLSVNLYMITYNRTGLLENFLMLCLLLVYFFFIRSLRHPKSGLWTGVFTALAGISKFLFLPFVFIPAICTWWSCRQKGEYSRLWYFLSGGLGAGILWGLLIYLPNPAFFSRIGNSWASQAFPAGIREALANLIGSPFPRFMVLMPLVFLMACWFVGKSLADLFRRDLEVSRLFAGLWIVVIFVEIGVLHYTPLRYFLPVILAGYLAVIHLIRDITAGGPVRLLAGGILGMGLAALLFGRFFSLLIQKPSAFFAFPAVLRMVFGLALLILVATPAVPSARSRRRMVAAVLLVGVIAGGFLYQRFFRHSAYQVEQAARRIHRLPADSFLMGQAAVRLAFDSGLEAILAYPGWFNDQDTFDRFPVTHIVSVEKFQEHRWIRQRYPAVFSEFQLVQKFPYWDTRFILLERDKENQP